MLIWITLGLFILAAISGMVGMGVAFAAVPFLSLFLDDLVNQVQPLTLLLNGATALFAALGFARAGYVENWTQAGLFALVATLSAPVGSYLARFLPQTVLWTLFCLCVVVLLILLFRPSRDDAEADNTSDSSSANVLMGLVIVAASTIVAAMLGMGPGFILVPALIGLGVPYQERGCGQRGGGHPSLFFGIGPTAIGPSAA